jgi:hypothetical protein
MICGRLSVAVFLLAAAVTGAAQSHDVSTAAIPALPSASAAIQPTSTAPVHPVTYSVWERARLDTWQWFAAPPETAKYGYLQSLLLMGAAQHINRWDWQLELAQAAVLGLPRDAVAPSPAQGQLGLGGPYYASNGNNSDPAAAFLKLGFVRYNFGKGKNIRLGRFEFLDGQEMHPTNPMVAWLQNNRVQQRLIGNFGFSNAMRSVDGVEAHYGSRSWDLTAMAARADQGVFNMNGNPELNVDVQYLALTRTAAHGRVLARTFGIGYHDGRTGLTKTDNRPLPVRQADHKNIRLGTYGGDVIATQAAGPPRRRRDRERSTLCSGVRCRMAGGAS